MTSPRTDIPTRAQLHALLTARAPAAVSIYLPTRPGSPGDAERIELKDLAGRAGDQLRVVGADRQVLAAVEEQLADLVDDDEFWRCQARGLAVFTAPGSLIAFRLPDDPAPAVLVADRFHVKPLLRAVTFPRAAFVLVLALDSVRLLEVLPDSGPTEVTVPGLPPTASTAGHARAEGGQVRMRQFSRQVDRALRPVLAGQEVPLVLSAAEPLDSVFRSVCGYPGLAPTTIPVGGPGAEDELAAEARVVLDALREQGMREVRDLFARRASQGRVVTDVSAVARFATLGAVDVLFLDVDAPEPGFLDDRTGVVEFHEHGDVVDHGVLDEICRRVWLTGGRVLGVGRSDVPGGGEVAAVLRFTPS
ncbi:baeRF11 domain-containing protein [Saccharothrix obliqua]|uniref:baeRF11 domain-containing protein n=1 Tax=Saccharothrix obliqua TaxID=2861747 RepID=UPI001C604BBA|nr:hypothetical protein [Saccharothrix obliqua]MBW4720502.1 hypothetical protein [Saccharothrix obliqua]